MTQIFLDCDGVLADFDTKVEAIFGCPRSEWDKLSDGQFWDRLYQVEGLFENLDPMPDAFDLVTGVTNLCDEYGLPYPIILTGKPRGEEFEQQKLRWRDKHFPDLEMIVTQSRKKKDSMRNPGDIIIDDWARYQQLWIDAGGRWILHKSAEQSLKELEQLLVE